ncbi:hypothetical protein GA707_05910 [Nostocoides sp. F2B08]|uniref:hypothetical protein n=1 Tax=Nostocoides sp. F2B08 TaxID=2653936 RepID=UPI001263B9D4|nr:hypothetical protein [Tetrasphaera sp. F2B08]KAB7745460.1 hypothetical protein GA707_05910 [Tetrasphaera sp. F2B08]
MRSVPPRPIIPWSVVLSVLVTISSLAGLLDSRVYDRETENWTIQAWGQDLGNLVAVVVLLIAAVRYRSGSHRAGLVWLGTLMYLIYAFIVYAMAVHLNYLFLVYVAVLGLSAWAVIFHVSDVRDRTTAYPPGRPRTVAAWVLILTGVLFAALWLGELVPALVTGSVPAGLTEAGLIVNPIHVIDLSVVLPGFIISGVAALQNRDYGLFWVAPWLTFSVLMGTSIVAAMTLMLVSGVGDSLPPAVLVSLIVVASLVALAGYLRAFGGDRDPATVGE